MNTTHEATGMGSMAVEKGSKAVPDPVFHELGGNGTSVLAKARMMDEGLVKTEGLHIVRAVELAPTGLTPAADFAAGVGGAGERSVVEVLRSNSK